MRSFEILFKRANVRRVVILAGGSFAIAVAIAFWHFLDLSEREATVKKEVPPMERLKMSPLPMQGMVAAPPISFASNLSKGGLLHETEIARPTSLLVGDALLPGASRELPLPEPGEPMLPEDSTGEPPQLEKPVEPPLEGSPECPLPGSWGAQIPAEFTSEVLEEPDWSEESMDQMLLEGGQKTILSESQGEPMLPEETGKPPLLEFSRETSLEGSPEDPLLPDLSGEPTR